MKELTLAQLPPLNALRAFEASARLLSFKEAAEELCVTPAAVSHQIRQLEEFLGVSLFKRTKSGVVLSEEGELLYPKLRQGFDLILEAILSLDQEQERNIIRVTAGPAFVAKWLVPSLSDFTKSHSDLEIDIIATLTSIDFKSSPVDLAVRFGNTPPSDLFSEKIIEEHMVPMVSPSLLPEGGLSSPSDLKSFELIHDKSISLIQDNAPGWKNWFEQVGVKEENPGRGVYFNQADHALQAAISGAGVVFGRLVLGLRDIIEGRLVIPFQHVIPTDLCFYFVHQLNPENEDSISSLKQWMSQNIEKDIDELGLEHILQSRP